MPPPLSCKMGSLRGRFVRQVLACYGIPVKSQNLSFTFQFSGHLIGSVQIKYLSMCCAQCPASGDVQHSHLPQWADVACRTIAHCTANVRLRSRM